MTTPEFVSSHVNWTATIHLTGPVDRVFPLFTPLGERYWAEGWNPQMYYPASGEPEVGAVFTTQHPGEETTIWVMAQYMPENGQINYARFAPDSHAGFISVQCNEANNGNTSATITYTLTALSESGNNYLAQLTETHYTQWITSWETAINHYLRHGHPVIHH